MATPGMILSSAGEREAGVACPHCRVRITFGESISLCQSCGSAHHADCWQNIGGCGSYSCAPATTRSTARPALVITTDEVHRAIPMERPMPTFEPSPTRRSSRRTPPARRLATHPLAILSLVLALMAAVPGVIILVFQPENTLTALMVLGTILIGLLTVVLAAIAMGSVLRGRSKGGISAGFGMAIALGDIVGVLLISFVIHAGLMQFGGGANVVFNELDPPDPTEWQGMDPSVERGLRANVLIRSSGLIGEALGSGVVVNIMNGQATILTNRHVIDPAFKGGATEPGDLESLHPNVQLLGQPNQLGRVTWIAPGGIDLAVVEVPCTSQEVKTALWEPNRRAKIGEKAFAVGNPNGNVWTYTEGPVSSFRKQRLGGREVKVIQIQTPLNPGNSGGGLYDQDGFLLGINTWAQDKRVSEGLNFAIDLDSVLRLLPASVKPKQPDDAVLVE